MCQIGGPAPWRCSADVPQGWARSGKRLVQPVKVGVAGTGLAGGADGCCGAGTVVVGAGGGVALTENACPEPPTMSPLSLMPCALAVSAPGRKPKSVMAPLRYKNAWALLPEI